MSGFDLSGLRKYAVMFVVAGLMLLFSLTSPYFFTSRNLLNIVTLLWQKPQQRLTPQRVRH